MTIWRMRITYWIPRAPHTQTRTQKIHCFSTATIVYERVSMLGLYVHCPPS